MQEEIAHCVIIGSSRGLGAALVEEFLKQTSYSIIGIARTSPDKISPYPTWNSTGRYRHIQLDIASSQCRDILQALSQELKPKPICIVFNAAHIKPDANEDQSINYEVFDQVNRVGIDGLGNILFAFEKHLLKHGGILVGISSFSAFAPPLISKVAYPATKAYLDMIFRCLRATWPENIKLVIVHLGHIGDWNTTFPRWRVPTYSMAAMKIIRSISGKNIPGEINYPLLYTLLYKYVCALLPDKVYLWTLRTFVKSRHLLKDNKS